MLFIIKLLLLLLILLLLLLLLTKTITHLNFIFKDVRMRFQEGNKIRNNC